MAWILVDGNGNPAPVANNWFQTKADAKYAAGYYAQSGPRYKVARANA